MQRLLSCFTCRCQPESRAIATLWPQNPFRAVWVSCRCISHRYRQEVEKEIMADKMDFLAQPKGLPRLWSCVMSDYECLLHQYVTEKGWTFSHFAKCAKEIQITLLYHASVAHGRKRDVLHERIGGVILNAAKDLWLHPGTLLKPVNKENEKDGTTPTDVDEDDDSVTLSEAEKKARAEFEAWRAEMKKRFDGGLDGEDSFLKYQLGAFFLTYLMYERQPYVGLLKILIDPNDYEQIVVFHAKVLKMRVELADEFRFICHKLRINHAFQLTGFSDKYDISVIARSFLNVKNDEMVELLKTDRRIIDALALSGITIDTEEQFGAYMKLKQKFLRRTRMNSAQNGHDHGVNWATGGYLAICEGPHSDSIVPETSLKGATLAETLESQQGIGEVATASTVVQEIGAKPIFTHAALLGNDMTSKMFMTEATKRLKRMQAKYQKDKEGPKSAKKSYNAGGIFSRAKEDEDDDDDGEGEEERAPVRTKGRAQTSNNLWNYIKGKGFNQGGGGEEHIHGNPAAAPRAKAKTDSNRATPAPTPVRVLPARKAKSEPKWKSEPKDGGTG